MTSQFGDFFDHISDAIKSIVIFYIIYIKAKPEFKNKIFLLILLFTILSLYHISLQELVYNKPEDSKSLNLINKYINLNKDNIVWSRYFGGGTIILVIVILIYLCISKKI